MSDFKVIGDVGMTLKKLLGADLWTGIPELSQPPEITFQSPKEIKDDGSPRVSLFLYQILENPYLKNEEPEKVGNTSIHLLPPLALDLLYLITPYGKDEIQKKYILGKVMQIFYDNSILTGTILQESLSGMDEEIKLLFNPISLDDLTKIWSAFQEAAYRLSVSYLVTPVRIDSKRETGMQRVVSKETGYYYAMQKGEKK